MSEEPVYNAVLNWVKYNDKTRADDMAILLSLVRLPLLSAKFITDVIDEEVGVL